MKKRILSLAAVLLVVFSLTAFAGCSAYKDFSKLIQADGNGDAGWHIRAVTQDKEPYEQKVGFSITRNSKTVKDVYMRVAGLDKSIEEISVLFTRYTGDLTASTSSDAYPQARVIGKNEINDALKNCDGWIKVNAESLKADSYSYIMMVTTGGFTVKEVVFVGDDGVMMTSAVDRADFWYKNSDGKIRGTNVMSKSDIDKIENSVDSVPNTLADSQSYYKDKDNEYWSKVPSPAAPAASAWSVSRLKDGDETYEQKVSFAVARGDKKVKDFWIKVKGVSAETPVKVVKSSYLTPTSGAECYTKYITPGATGWVRINDADMNEDSSSYALSTLGGLTIEEAAFIGEDGTFLTSAVSRASFRYKTKSGNESKLENAVLTTIKNVINSADGLPYALCDDQANAEKSEFWKDATSEKSAARSWKVGKYEEDDGSAFLQKVGFKYEGELKEVRIKVSEVSGDGATVNMTRITGETSLTAYSGATESEKFEKKLTAEDVGKWVTLNPTDINSTARYFMLTTEGGLTIDEIEFIGSDGEKMAVSITRCTIKYTTVDGVVKTQTNALATVIKNIINSADGIPNFIIDEA